jgi:hypothetical protein
MIRPVRMLIIALSAVLVLCTMQVDVSAKKKSSKRKSRAARNAPVIVIAPVVRSVPVIVKQPVLTPAAGNDFFSNMSAPGQRASAPSAAAAAGSGSSSGAAPGDNEATEKRHLRNYQSGPSLRAAGQLVISEFRLTGTSGVNDEFIEIYNDFGADHTVAASSGTGYGIAASDGIVRCIIPNGTIIPARGHYLCVNSVAYSLSTYPSGNNGVSATTATGDATYVTGITDGEDPDGMGPLPPDPRQGIALFNTSVPANFALATRFDAAGPVEEANTLYKEGAGLPNLTPFSTNQAWVRDTCGKGGAIAVVAGQCTISTPKDTDDNAADFFYVDTNGTSAGAGQRLGAPGPENLSSPIQRNSSIAENLLDNTVARQNPPNRVRDFTSDPGNNSQFGTLSIRRRFVNQTGASITRLRFRIIDFNTFPAPSGIADLRARNSSLVVIAGINDAATCAATGAPAIPPCTVSAQGTTVDVATPLGTGQPNGGGFNSSMSAGTVTLGTPLANGASINLIFLFGIQQTGSFRVYVNVEALP